MLTSNDISSIQSTLQQNPINVNLVTNGTLNNPEVSNTISVVNSNVNKVAAVSEQISSIVNDTAIASPTDIIQSVLTAVLFKINSLVHVIETKIDDLVNNTISFSTGNAKVSFEGNIITITVSPNDAAQGELIKQKIQSQLSSISATLSVLSSTVTILNTISQTISIINDALDVLEIALTINPVSAASYKVFKTAIKIVFTRQMMKQYSTMLKDFISQNEMILNNLLQRFNNLYINLNISQNNNLITPEQAQQNIVQNNLNQVSLSSFSVINGVNNLEKYSTIYGKYRIVVEKYNNGKELIARAYDVYSGMILEETAPSYTETPDELINELKSILNIY